jgi:hypothetical protein
VSHIRNVHESLGRAGEAHRLTREDALRQAAVARAEAEAAQATAAEETPTPESSSDA